MNGTETLSENTCCDIAIAGCGVAGLYTALNLPDEKEIIIICKEDVESCDSMLAQGGICVLHDENDYDAFFDDTMKAGHYENRKESVDTMIRNSRSVINDLISYGVDFERNSEGELLYTREGAHSRPRICYHKDITGKEITTKLLAAVRKLSNVKIFEYTEMTDIITSNSGCNGFIVKTKDSRTCRIYARDTVMATGGIGGLYEHSTNFPSLTGDGCRICREHDIELEHMDYVQIHPTSLFVKSESGKKERSFLISESCRGEGAVLLNHKGERFVNELLPRDVVSSAIFEEMKKEHAEHEFLSFQNIAPEEIKKHFPNIYKKCAEEGYDILMEPIPVVPAQHYFMGGIHVDSASRTTMNHLYAVGETSCNGVHGKNRLASNSLLESLVFAKIAARDITENQKTKTEAEKTSA